MSSEFLIYNQPSIHRIFERLYSIKLDLVSEPKANNLQDIKHLKSIISRHSQAVDYDTDNEALTLEGVRVAKDSAQEIGQQLKNHIVAKLTSSKSPRAKETLNLYIQENNLSVYTSIESEFLGIPPEIDSKVLECYREIQTYFGSEIAKKYALQKLTKTEKQEIFDKKIVISKFPLSSFEYSAGYAFILLNRIYEFAKASKGNELDISVGHSMSLWFFRMH